MDQKLGAGHHRLYSHINWISFRGADQDFAEFYIEALRSGSHNICFEGVKLFEPAPAR